MIENIISATANSEVESTPAAVTIGFFDGVHRGHRYLLEVLKQEAVARGQRALIVTFDIHPRQVVHADYVPQLLTTQAERVALLQEFLPVEVLHFSPQLSRLTVRQFMQDVLRDRLGVRTLVMGYDHRFGSDGGSSADYERWGKQVGIDVVRAGAFTEEAVSSSRIRALLQEGRVEDAARILTRPYALSGTVVHGQQVGRTIGFPTLNLQCDAQKLLPKRGVYAVEATLSDGQQRSGMLCIGSRPTLQSDAPVSVEAHLFDFEGDLYGQQVTLRLTAFLREEKKFNSLEELRRQLEADAEQLRHRN